MKGLRELIPLLALLGVALLLPGLPFGGQTGQRILSVGGFVMIYVVLALGLNVVTGWTGLLDLGYVAFVAIGAYTTAILYRQPWMQFEGAWLICLGISGIHCALWGAIRGAPTLRLVGDYYAIVTFAFAQIVLIFAQNCTPVTNAAKGYTDYPMIRVLGHATGVGILPGGTTIEMPDGAAGINVQGGGRLVFPRGGEAWVPTPGVPLEVPADVKVWPNATFKWVNLPSGAKVTIPGPGYEYRRPGKPVAADSRGFYFVLLAFVTLTVFAMIRLRDSRLGRAWLAMKADEISAKANGISIQRHRIIAFAVSGFVGGIGGGLMAFKVEIVTPGSYDFWVSVLILACIVLGGMGSIRGVVVGTVALISLGEILREGFELGPGLSSFLMTKLHWLENVAWQATGDHAMLKVPDQARYLVFGAILVLVMIFRPQGLLPQRQTCEPLSPEDEARLRATPSPLFGTAKK